MSRAKMNDKPFIPNSPSDAQYKAEQRDGIAAAPEHFGIAEDQGDVFAAGGGGQDPFALFRDWFELAKQTEANDPNAMAVATVDPSGMPNNRVVLLKDADARGFSFFTNQHSAKGKELAETQKAALVFHWKTLRRQVRIRGIVDMLPISDNDIYFDSRARGSQIGAHASLQSDRLENPMHLKAAVTETEMKFEGQTIPRPPHWGGYIVIPTEIEFWVNRPYRLHDRLQFRRKDAAESWQVDWLYP